MPGQLLKLGHKFEAKIEAKPTLRSGQANGARLGFIVCPQKIGRQSLILTFLVNRQEVIKICVLKRNKRFHIDLINSLCIELREFISMLFFIATKI